MRLVCKSTLLQTLSLNLAKANTPEQVHLNLLGFGNNGLLPLTELPHVAAIVTLEETEEEEGMFSAWLPCQVGWGTAHLT